MLDIASVIPGPRLRFHLLGPLELEVDGTLADLGGPHQRAILALLLVQRNRAVQRSEIVDRVWGPDAPLTAGHAVEVYISRLRRFTDPGVGRGGHRVLCTVRGGYVIRIPAEEVDLAAFERLMRMAETASRQKDLATAARLSGEALALWRGPALADLRDFEFAITVADRIEDLRIAAMEYRARDIVGRARDLAGRADPGTPLQELSRWVAENPLRESLVEQLMVARRDAGDIPGALATYHRSRRALGAVLGVQPSESLRALAASIANTGVSSGRHDAPRLTVPSRAVIGREADIAEVMDLVRRHTLVTLTGYPGIGRTTIALEVCRRLQPEFEAGVYVVDLAAVSDGRQISEQVARALGLQDQSARRNVEVLRTFLANRRVVLLFDNGDHLVSDLKVAANERQGNPGVHLLVTAVTPLGAQGEEVYNVGPLSLPPSSRDTDMATSGAVALLRDRLVMQNSEFEMRPVDLEAAYRICHRLDGLPLAIELAAAQNSVHSLPELADLLERDLSLVSSHSGPPDRARGSLESALESAYSALDRPFRRVLVAAATFRGTIRVEMLLHVAGIARMRHDRQLALVDDLVNLALLTRTLVGTHRELRMLEPTRTFILRKAGPDVVEDFRNRYVESFASHCEEVLPRLERGGQVEALAWLEEEFDNIRTTLRALLDGRRAARALAITGSLGRFWWVRGHLTEGRRWLKEALQACPEASFARSEALRVLAYLEWSQGEVEVAECRCLEALQTSIEIAHPVAIARSRYYLGVAQHANGRLEDASATLRQALATVRSLPDPALEGLVLDMLARALTASGRQQEGRGASERSLALLNAGGDAFGVAACLINLGESQVRDDEIAPARRAYTEALQRFHELHCVVGEGFALQGLAWVAGAEGDSAAARRLLGEMRDCWERSGYIPIEEEEQRNAEILAGVPAQ